VVLDLRGKTRLIKTSLNKKPRSWQRGFKKENILRKLPRLTQYKYYTKKNKHCQVIELLNWNYNAHEVIILMIIVLLNTKMVISLKTYTVKTFNSLNLVELKKKQTELINKLFEIKQNKSVLSKKLNVEVYA